MDHTAEYNRKVRRLLRVAESLADSLVHEAPTEFSRSYFDRSASRLRFATAALKAALQSGASKPELRAKAHEVKEVLHQISAAETKGEIPIARPELVSEAIELVYVFQEIKYAGA